jgi:hypothetical protein
MEIVKDLPEEVTIALSVNCVRTPLRVEKLLTIKQNIPALFLHETVTNLSDETVDFMWGHHPAFGSPFISKGTKLFLPARTGEVHQPRFASSGIFEPGTKFEWPRIKSQDGTEHDLSVLPGENGGYADLIYLDRLDMGWYAVINQDKKIGFGLAWDLDVFPNLWYWMVFGTAPGYPWWNRVHCIALEPWSSYPNHLEKVIDQQRQIKLEGGGQKKVSVTAVAIHGMETVKQISLEGVVE